MNVNAQALGGAAIAALAVFVGLDMRDDHKFAETAEARFEAIDRLERSFEQRMSSIETIDRRVADRLQSLEGLEQAVVGSADTVEALEKSVSRRLGEFAGLDKSLKSRADKAARLEQTAIRLESALSKRAEEMRTALAAMDRKLSDLDKRVAAAGAQSQHLAEIDGRLNAVDALLADLAMRIVKLEQDAKAPALAESSEPASALSAPAAAPMIAVPPEASPAAEEDEQVRLSPGETLKVRENQLFLSRLTADEAYFIIDFAERANAAIDLSPITLASGCAVQLKSVVEGKAALSVDCG